MIRRFRGDDVPKNLTADMEYLIITVDDYVDNIEAEIRALQCCGNCGASVYTDRMCRISQREEGCQRWYRNDR